MRHLFASNFQVLRLDYTVVNGRPTMGWTVPVDSDQMKQALYNSFRARLDMTFQRPGKDILPAPEQGKAPDRIGVLFCGGETPIKAGDRIKSVPNAYGQMPVEGTFEIRYVPDHAIAMGMAHHIEVQVVEVNQAISEANWPKDGPRP